MDSIRLTVTRGERTQTFEVASGQTLLAALVSIKENDDATLTFGAGCRSGVCGACAMRVNGREVLACSYKPKEGDMVEPLQYHPHSRDLKVDKRQAYATLDTIQTWLHDYNEAALPTPEDEARTERQSDCILCDSCYSACPVFAVNGEFAGPFALTRAFRYVEDVRENDTRSIIDLIQQNGVWDCTLCGECTAVCPKGIDPKSDIMQLRALSVQAGYSDPSFAQQSFGGPDFGGGFGFDPNAGF